jgi:lysophospholipase L1-like esterase
MTTPATGAAGAPATFGTPVTSGGRSPVSVSCSPASGQMFPVGSTTVNCTAQDAAGSSASCSFNVAVAAAPRLTRTRFMAFGDSVTSGEVTVPMGVTASGTSWGRLVVVPSASYPTRLNERLTRTYVAQTVTVSNAGRSGEWAADAPPRFATALSQQNPEVVLLLMGYNDLGTSRFVSEGAAALDRMVRDATAQGRRVFLATLAPTIPGREHSVDAGLLDNMNGRIRGIASAQGAVLVDVYQALQPSASMWIGVDGVHPNEAGYERIAEVFFDAVRANLEAR